MCNVVIWISIRGKQRHMNILVDSKDQLPYLAGKSEAAQSTEVDLSVEFNLISLRGEKSLSLCLTEVQGVKQTTCDSGNLDGLKKNLSSYYVQCN